MATETEEKDLDITETIGRTELFIEENKKNISIGLGVIIVLVGGFFAYKKFVLEPKEKEAQSQMFVAERYFEMDSLNLAINGDGGNYIGFEAVINNYGMTKSANLAQYYLGMCYLKKGEFEKAIEHLNKFNGKDELLGPIAIGAIGDANMELGKTEDAISYYRKAAELKNNEFTTPIFLMKTGFAYEKANKYADAVAQYEKIKNDYSKSNEASNIDKYIARAKANIQ